MRVTEMRASHLDALAAIERACFAEPWSADALREELGRGIFLTAEADGAAVGYVGCQTVLDEGYITNVAVSPGFRRQGAARALLAELETRARAQELSFVTLEVRASNDAAIALYTGAGYVPVGRRKNFYRAPVEDAVLMTLFLREPEGQV